ncbi:ATP-binding protein [Pseudomonas sp. RtIB026]|uniref:ATP-binding protein n=1 Tax=Pseudomonas sp. RtIB026 TaxID=2749999 RepID=UPI001FD1B2AF|nr:ATP-binding protein [Pseudomonas sp. RtIB026]
MLSDEERAWIQANPVVRVAVEPDWTPIEYLENGSLKGLAAEYLAIVEQSTGLRFEPVPGTGWTSVAGMLERHEVDMVSSLVSGFAPPAFANLVYETRTYSIANTFIFAHQDHSMIFDIKQLEGKVVAIKGWGEYESKVRALYPTLNILRTRTSEDALVAVVEGRADVAMGVGKTMLPYLRRKYDGLLQMSGGIASLSVELTMGVRRDQLILHGIIDKALASISADRFFEIEERSFGSATYGAPTLRVLLDHYGAVIGLALISVLLILFFALHARKERRLAVRSEHEKQMFIAVLSHEIRTPMNAIIASIELLGRSNELSGESRRLLDLARSGSENLLYLLNDVLDVSKLEAGALQLDYAPTDITQLVVSVVDLFAAKAQEQGLTLELLPESAVESLLMLDKARMEQILQNLITNAIKFTAVGGVKVSVGLNEDASASGVGLLRIQVIDSGIGIDPKSLEKLFKPYGQAGENTQRNGGSGLGLLICRQLCELMGGEIALDSELGKGTVATVSIPCEVRGPHAERSAEAVPGPGAFQVRALEQTCGVLLVEDTAASRIVLQAQLEVLGCQVTAVETGADALRALEQHRYDIVLLDWHLPDTTGFEVARCWRHTEVARGIAPTPIVAVSARSGPEHTIACFEAGMNGVLSKPIQLGKLRDTLQLWTNMPIIETAQDSLSISNLEAATQSLWEDADALDMAIQDRDKEAALYRVHRLLGACSVLGYSSLILCLKDLQAHVQEAGYGQAHQELMQFRLILAKESASS